MQKSVRKSKLNVAQKSAVVECSSLEIAVNAAEYVVQRLFDRIKENEIRQVLPVYSTRFYNAAAINAISMAPTIKLKAENFE